MSNLLVNGSRGDNFKIVIDDLGKFIEILQEEKKELAKHTGEVFDKSWQQKKAFIDSLVAKVTSVHWDKRTQAHKVLDGEYNLSSKTDKVESYLDSNKQAGREYSKYKRMSEQFPVASRNKYTLPNTMLKVADGLLKGKETEDIAKEMQVKLDTVLQQRNGLRKILGTGKNNDKLITELGKIQQRDFKVDKSKYEILEVYANKEKMEVDKLKTSSVNKLEERNQLGFEIKQNIADYKTLLAEYNIDGKKLNAHAIKHQEKINTEQKPSLKDIKIKTDRPSTSKNYIDKNIVIDNLHSNIEKFTTDLLGEPSNVSGNTMSWGNKRSLQVQFSGAKAGWWYDFKQGVGNRDLLSLYLHRTGQTFKDGLERLSKDLNINDINSLTQTQRELQQSKKAENLRLDEIKEKQKQSQRVTWAHNLYKNAKPLEGSLAEKYLRQHRGIDCKLPESFRFHPSIKQSELGKKFPAMLAPIQDCDGKFKGVMRIYLGRNGNKLNKTFKSQDGKTATAINKADLGKKQENFVLINKGQNNEKVYLAEGIETGLSLVGSCKEHTVLSVLSVWNFKSVKLFADTKEVVICADRDGINTQANQSLLKAVDSLQEKGIKVSVVMPEISRPNQKLDFNDLLLEKGQEAVTKRLNSPVALDLSEPSWRVKEATKLYNNSKNIKGTIGERYFNSLDSYVPEHFRFNNDVIHPDIKNKQFLAVIAPIQDKKDNLQGVVKVYLDDEGNKLKPKDNKAFESIIDIGRKKGNFVMLNSGQDNKLYLTNNLEDGISIMSHCKDSAVLSVLSLQNFKEIKPFNNTNDIIICLSKDDIVNNPNIFQAIEHFKSQGLDVSIRVPEISDGKSLSFQSLLQEQGRDAIRDSLNKPMEISKANDNVIAI
ncbi:MAG: toprim domain-containing protein, partial [Legionellales bacterium]|nr:toprim domain-containing protein [Legionellales bacterium]